MRFAITSVRPGHQPTCVDTQLRLGNDAENSSFPCLLEAGASKTGIPKLLDVDPARLENGGAWITSGFAIVARNIQRLGAVLREQEQQAADRRRGPYKKAA